MLADPIPFDLERPLRPKPPAYLHSPEYVLTTGRDVALLCLKAGFPPDDQQQLMLDAIFGRTEEGLLAVRHGVIVGPRQSTGKTGLFKQASIGWLYVEQIPLVVYSAHNSMAYEEMVEGMRELILGCPDLAAETVDISTNDAGVTLETIWGGRMLFRVRTPANGRSLSAPRVILDEGYAVKPAHVGALMPTITAQADPQILTGSSHPKAESDWLRDMQDQGRVGSDPTMFYMEYKAPDPEIACDLGKRCKHLRGTPGCGCDKPEMIAIANPQYGGRARPETFLTLRTSMTPAEYGREMMGWRDESSITLKCLIPEVWDRQADVESRLTGTLGIGAAIAPDRSVTYIAVCGRREDGDLHVELVWRELGALGHIDQIADLAERHAAVAVAIAPGAREKISEDDLALKGIHADKKRPRKRELILVGSREFAQACGALVDDLDNRRVWHIGQTELDGAAKTSVKRPLAGAWAWGMGTGPDAVDVTPMDAVTLARYAFIHGEATALPAPFIISSARRRGGRER
jgi:hypothetical protein